MKLYNRINFKLHFLVEIMSFIFEHQSEIYDISLYLSENSLYLEKAINTAIKKYIYYLYYTRNVPKIYYSVSPVYMCITQYNLI